MGICISDWSELIADSHGLQVRKFLQVEERLVAGDSIRFSPESVLMCGYLEDTLNLLVTKLEDCILRSDLGGRTTLSSPSKVLLNTVHEPKTADDVWSGFGTETYVKAAGTPSTFLDGSTIATSPDIRSTEYCHPGVFFKVLGDYLDDDAVVCCDIGDNSLFVASALPAKKGQRFLTVSACLKLPMHRNGIIFLCPLMEYLYCLLFPLERASRHHGICCE